MRRRQRQCPVWSCFFFTLQCQRLAGHQGAHAASGSERHERHWAWTDEDPHTIDHLPGTVRFPRPGPSRVGKAARFLGEWTANALIAALLWQWVSLGSALVYLVVQVLLSAQRSHFVDFGRFTVGVWPASPNVPPAIFAISWLWHGQGRNAKRAGLEVVLGRVSVGAHALAPRKEWAASKRERAALRAAQKGHRR
ncbi:hypothetical protein [Streptomyces glaucus]|uniref:Integral membrane protein n=1 Tax=Streptomyces glaucus TaxID=284029 RepID=A0ABN3JTB9_9ACTN